MSVLGSPEERQMKCLIVDDEVFCREFVAALLEELGECHQADGADEALAKFSEALGSDAPYDLIVLDILMPGQSGHEAAKVIRRIEKERHAAKKVNIVMLTGLNSANDAMESFCSAESAAYLVKPVSKEGLLNVISKLGLLKTG